MNRLICPLLAMSIATIDSSGALAQVTVVGTASSTSVPENITPIPSGFGTNAGDYFVPDYSNGNIDIFPAAGGALTTFAASGVENPIGGTFIPTGYGSLSGQYLVESAAYSGGLSAVSSTGSVTSIIPIGQTTSSNGITTANYAGTPIVAPVGFGNVANQVLLGGFETNTNAGTATAQILTLNPNGSLSLFASLIQSANNTAGYVDPFGMAFAPTGFGSVGGKLLVTDGASGTIEAVNSSGQVSIWATVPGAGETLANGQQTGLRQIAFAPAGYGSYGGDLFVSVSGSQQGGGTSGQVDVLNSAGSVIAVLDQGTVESPFDPRGLTFTGNGQLLIADTDPSILAVTPAAFTPVPLPAAAWLMLSGVAGLGAFSRRKRGA